MKMGQECPQMSIMLHGWLCLPDIVLWVWGQVKAQKAHCWMRRLGKGVTMSKLGASRNNLVHVQGGLRGVPGVHYPLWPMAHNDPGSVVCPCDTRTVARLLHSFPTCTPPQSIWCWNICFIWSMKQFIWFNCNPSYNFSWVGNIF